MRLDRVTGLGGQRIHRQRHRLRIGRVDHRDVSAAGQPRCHRPVLGLDRLDGQPADSGAGQLLQQVPDGLRLAGAGGAGDQGVPVQRRQRHAERADRPVLAVEDRAKLDCRPVPGRFAGDVEVAGPHDADARHLPPRQSGQRGQRAGRRGERHHRAVRRVGQLGRQHVRELLRALGAAQPVRMRAQVGRPDQHAARSAAGPARWPLRPAPARSTGRPRGTRPARPAGARPAPRRTARARRRTGAARSSWLRSSAVSASSRSVGSATISQPNGRPISVCSADSNSVGGTGPRWRRRPAAGGGERHLAARARRPDQLIEVGEHVAVDGDSARAPGEQQLHAGAATVLRARSPGSSAAISRGRSETRDLLARRPGLGRAACRRQRPGLRDQLERCAAAARQPAGDERPPVPGGVQRGRQDRGVVPAAVPPRPPALTA